MKRLHLLFAALMLMLLMSLSGFAQSRRPIDSKHPLWLIHVDVWNKADPQKIIDLIPEDIRPYVCMNLSLSCQYDTEKNVYKMPQNAVRTYKSWASVCQHNNMWFTCQPASGGHTHIQDDDIETFEYFFKHYPNFLGWNYAEQFWGFDEAGDKSSSSQTSRIALFAKLVEMSHNYGGFLTVSFCGNIWSHPLNPIGMMKRNANLLSACKKYPEAILWLYKYTTSSCFYNNESVTFGPFVSGLANNYGVRYDNCGYNGALDGVLGSNHGKKYPVAAGIGTVMEQTCQNGGAVWDGPELIWTEDFQNLNNSTVNGYTRRNWGTFAGFRNAWIDMFRKVIDGTMYIPTRKEVVGNVKCVIVNNMTSGSDEDKYAAWGDLYDGVYKQTDPMNPNGGQWMNNYCYFKSTGRYGTLPITVELYDSLAKTIPYQVKKSQHSTVWSSLNVKTNRLNKLYPEISTGDLFVSRFKNQLIAYTPYSYLNGNKTATANVPLEYNTCESLDITLGKLCSGIIREYSDSITCYLNNYRSDTTTLITDKIIVNGSATEPSYTMTKRVEAKATASAEWNEETGTYTITVNHNGPVDMVIKCSGSNTERQSDIADHDVLPTPVQPAKYNGELIIEAEDMDYKNISSCVTDPYSWYPNVRGHAGNGFMDMGTNTAGGLRTVLKNMEAGSYNVTIRYTNTAKIGNITCKANATTKSLRLQKTSTNEWAKVSFTAQLNAGDNTFTLTNTSGVAAYIDQVIFTPDTIPAETFGISIREAENGTVTADAETASEGSTVQLNVSPAEGYTLAGWNIIHGNITITDDNTFVMPDDNVCLQPIFADATCVYEMNLDNTLAGTIPEGWRAIQGESDIHEYPNTYSSGSRVFSGFGGKYSKALYWRVMSADYGRQSGYHMTLKPGSYKLTYAMAAWKGTPQYKAQILATDGSIVAETSYTKATPNANGNSAASLSATAEQELEFTIEAEGDYVINFQNNGTDFSEFLLVECRINSVLQHEDAISLICQDIDIEDCTIYNAQGIRIPTLQRGLNIITRKGMVVRKVIVK